MTMHPLLEWTPAKVDAECAREHGRYDRELALHYTNYFNANPGLRGVQRFSAKDIEAALPPGWGSLQQLLPADKWHSKHLSGKSSQVLLLGLLGVAASRDRSLTWLWDALSPIAPTRMQQPDIRFEHTLPATLLNEHPWQTAIDVLVETPEVVICIEAKWREDGLGSCDCSRDKEPGDPTIGECSPRVVARTAYWTAASEVFRLPDRSPPDPCPITLAYQAVRNVAAARTLANGREAVFALLYDDRNPYFRPTGAWRGWPCLLRDSLADAPEDFSFRAISWQELSPLLPLDDATRQWAAEKHGLGAGAVPA